MKGGFYMKKIIMVLIILTGAFLISNQESSKVIIPKEAIRFRVIANSDTKKDQEQKKKVASNLQENVTNLLIKTNSLEDARMTLKNNIGTFKANIEKTLYENQIEESYEIDYGNHYFPEKTYKGVTYKEGEYESLVVTLGNGEGENFWCVLFPPLCLLEAEESDNKEVEYSSFVKEMLDKYFS